MNPSTAPKIEAKNIFEICPWLNTHYHFETYDLDIQDEVNKYHSHGFRDGVKSFKLRQLTRTSLDELQITVKAALLAEGGLDTCDFYDANGKRLEQYWFADDGGLVCDCSSYKFEDVKYLVLRSYGGGRTMIFYELV